MDLVLYDLAAADPARRFSPYCWRVRMALAHKGLPVETIPWRFTDKSLIEASNQGQVPVLVHDNLWLSDSWEIANYLETTFPDRPSLFGGDAGVALSRLYSNLADWLSGQIIRFVLLDIYQHLHPNDQPYFRQSREARFGMPLEQVVADRNQHLSGFRKSLAPIRNTLVSQPYFGGKQPLYADYALFGPFQWARCISAYPLLDPEDPIALWRQRMLCEFNGLAASVPAYD